MDRLLTWSSVLRKKEKNIPPANHFTKFGERGGAPTTVECSTAHLAKLREMVGWGNDDMIMCIMNTILNKPAPDSLCQQQLAFALLSHSTVVSY